MANIAADQIEISQDIFVEATSLVRRDLPNRFPYQVFNEGFAIVRVRIRNDSVSDYWVDSEKMRLYNPNGKVIERVRSSDLTPRLIKYYQGEGNKDWNINIPGKPNIYIGRRGRYGRMSDVNVRGGSPPGTIHVGKVQELKQLLEQHEMKPTNIAPGKRMESLIYLKSKKSGNRLIGGHIELTDKQVVNDCL